MNSNIFLKLISIFQVQQQLLLWSSIICYGVEIS